MPSMDMLRRFAGANEGDTEVLGLCLNAAVEWYERAGVAAREGDDLYDLWTCNLAAWFYDNRGAPGENAVVPPYIVASVHQLRKKRTTTTDTGGGTA